MKSSFRATSVQVPFGAVCPKCGNPAVHVFTVDITIPFGTSLEQTANIIDTWSKEAREQIEGYYSDPRSKFKYHGLHDMETVCPYCKAELPRDKGVTVFKDYSAALEWVISLTKEKNDGNIIGINPISNKTGYVYSHAYLPADMQTDETILLCELPTASGEITFPSNKLFDAQNFMNRPCECCGTPNGLLDRYCSICGTKLL